MSSLSQVIDALVGDNFGTLRPEQREPAGDWLIWLILAGRGWGKSFTGSSWLCSVAEAALVSHSAMVGPTDGDVRGTMIEGISGVLSVCRNDFRPLYEPSKRRITWPNGHVTQYFSSEEPERLRGPQHGAALCDELAAWKNLGETWNQLNFGLRIGPRPRTVITTTPKPVKLLRDLVKRAAEGGSVVITKGSTFDNAANLAPSFLEDIKRQFSGTRTGRQELFAEILDDNPGALWSRDLIERTRVKEVHWSELKRVVVAIDPAVSMGENSAETGIVVAGVGHDDHVYVLCDLSGRYAPHEWARQAVGGFRHYRADRIVAEANQGGAMVEATIRAVDPNVPVTMVHASRGKITRAEPVSALWEQGRGHLVGAEFEALEDQMASYEAGSPNSPDRLDALVWAVTNLTTQRPRAVLHFG